MTDNIVQAGAGLTRGPKGGCAAAYKSGLGLHSAKGCRHTREWFEMVPIHPAVPPALFAVGGEVLVEVQPGDLRRPGSSMTECPPRTRADAGTVSSKEGVHNGRPQGKNRALVLLGLHFACRRGQHQREAGGERNLPICNGAHRRFVSPGRREQPNRTGRPQRGDIYRVTASAGALALPTHHKGPRPAIIRLALRHSGRGS